MEDDILKDFIQCKPPYRRYYIKKDGSQVYDGLKEKLVKTHKVPEGYVILNGMITDDGKNTLPRLHRLIALNLIPIPERLQSVPIEKLQINHIDENPSNNDISNIEWCTYEENINHGNRNKNVTRNLWKTRTVYQYDKNTLELIRVYHNTHEPESYGFTSDGVSRCCNGIYKQYKGYIFTYDKIGDDKANRAKQLTIVF